MPRTARELASAMGLRPPVVGVPAGAPVGVGIIAPPRDPWTLINGVPPAIGDGITPARPCMIASHVERLVSDIPGEAKSIVSTPGTCLEVSRSAMSQDMESARWRSATSVTATHWLAPIASCVRNP